MNAFASPPETASRDRDRPTLSERLAKAQALTFSALIHAIAIIVLGGTVLLQQQEEVPDFTAEGGPLVNQAEVQNTPPQETPQMKSDLAPSAETSAPSTPASTALVALTSSSATTTFAMNATPTLTPTIKMTPDTAKPMTAPPPGARGSLSKEMAGKISGFTSGWAKGGTAAMSRPLKSREFQFTAYLAKYQGGDWDSTVWFRDGKPEVAGGSLPNMLYLIGKLSKGKIHAEPQPVPLDLSSEEIYEKKPPFIFFTGHRDFKLTEKEVANLAEYLRNGGCIWGDSSVPGQRSRFDIAFRREMLRLVPPGEQWGALPPNHPIFVQNYFPEINKPPPGVNYYDEPIYALVGYGGSIAIIYTANDYGDMWQFGLDDEYKFDLIRDEKRRMVSTNEEMWHRRGLYFRNIDEKAVLETYKFGTNVVVHLLTRWEDKLRNAPKVTF
jgi:hypothetical protein